VPAEPVAEFTQLPLRLGDQVHALIGFRGLMLQALSEKHNSFLRPLKKKGFREKRVTTIGLYDIGKSHDPGIQQEPPAMIREAFATDLLGAAAFTDGMDQLDPIGVDDAEHRRRSQEDLRPVLMRLEEAEEPGALGEARKQGPIVARQPPMERPVPHTFEGMEQPQGDHLTGPEVGLGVFGHVV
jgi:hypothetical protein